MQLRRSFRALFALAIFCLIGLAFPAHLRAQDDDATQPPEKHGRKYKAPPITSHIEVTVIKGFNKKPVDGAHVVFHPVKDGVDEGNLEVKTDPDGKASIDVIPTGSSVRVQVIADGFATFADDYVISEPSRQILIAMVRPRAQISTYIDNQGKAAEIKPGIQEPVRPKAGVPATPVAPSSGAAPSSSPAPSSSVPVSPKPQP